MPGGLGLISPGLGRGYGVPPNIRSSGSGGDIWGPGSKKSPHSLFWGRGRVIARGRCLTRNGVWSGIKEARPPYRVRARKSSVGDTRGEIRGITPYIGGGRPNSRGQAAPYLLGEGGHRGTLHIWGGEEVNNLSQNGVGPRRRATPHGAYEAGAPITGEKGKHIKNPVDHPHGGGRTIQDHMVVRASVPCGCSQQ